MKSLASITEKDIETIKMALNDSLSDMNMELRGDLSAKKRNDLLEYKSKYTKVLDKLEKNPSIYALLDFELDIAASGLNDAIELLETNLTDDLTEQEKNDILGYKSECERLVELLSR